MLNAKVLFFIFFYINPVLSSAQRGKESIAAKRFIAALNTNQQKNTVFPLADTNRFKWYYVPSKNRKGISLNEMDEKQKQLSFILLQSVLSNKAYIQSKDIMNLENLLKQLEPNRESWVRDAGNYRFIFFGNPLREKVYSWRFEGHHISLIFSSYNQTLVSATPAFLGSNPAIVLDGPDKGKEIFKDESELAFSFLHSLDADQVNKAVLYTNVPEDIVTGNKRKVVLEKPKGISYSELNKNQQKLLIELISLYINRNTRLLANKMMQEIKNDGLENLYFLWIGAQQKQLGKPHYYRIQGPGFLIEFDNTQNNANHVHSVLRDFKHDFGGDELEKHYKEKH